MNLLSSLSRPSDKHTTSSDDPAHRLPAAAPHVLQNTSQAAGLASLQITNTVSRVPEMIDLTMSL
jgi:hypothetical protein